MTAAALTAAVLTTLYVLKFGLSLDLALYFWPAPFAVWVAARCRPRWTAVVAGFGPIVLLVGIAAVYGVFYAHDPGSFECAHVNDCVFSGPSAAVMGIAAYALLESFALELGLAGGLLVRGAVLGIANLRLRLRAGR